MSDDIDENEFKKKFLIKQQALYSSLYKARGINWFILLGSHTRSSQTYLRRHLVQTFYTLTIDVWLRQSLTDAYFGQDNLQGYEHGEYAWINKSVKR